MSDIQRGLDLIATLASDTDTCEVLVINGEPRSKARPRVGKRGHVYTPSKPYEEALAWNIKAARVQKRMGTVAIGVIFYRSSFQRVDVDNMLKLVLDAGTMAGIWDDDHQVTAVMGIVELDRVKPRTVIVLGDHVTSFTRPTRKCLICQTTIVLSAQRPNRKYCSQDCRYAAVRLDKPRIGRGVGPKEQHPARCRDCDKTLTKRSFVRCRECWVIARKKGIS